MSSFLQRVRWIFDSFRFKNEFPEFIPSLALVSLVSAASKSVFTEYKEKPMTNYRFVDNMAVRNVLPGQKRHLFPLSCYPAIRIYPVYTLYFKKRTETDFGSHATCHITG